MGTQTETLQLVAKDDASKVVDRLQKKLDKLKKTANSVFGKQAGTQALNQFNRTVQKAQQLNRELERASRSSSSLMRNMKSLSAQRGGLGRAVEQSRQISNNLNAASRSTNRINRSTNNQTSGQALRRNSKTQNDAAGRAGLASPLSPGRGRVTHDSQQQDMARATAALMKAAHSLQSAAALGAGEDAGARMPFIPRFRAGASTVERDAPARTASESKSLRKQFIADLRGAKSQKDLDRVVAAMKSHKDIRSKEFRKIIRDVTEAKAMKTNMRDAESALRRWHGSAGQKTARTSGLSSFGALGIERFLSKSRKKIDDAMGRARYNMLHPLMQKAWTSHVRVEKLRSQKYAPGSVERTDGGDRFRVDKENKITRQKMRRAAYLSAMRKGGVKIPDAALLPLMNQEFVEKGNRILRKIAARTQVKRAMPIDHPEKYIVQRAKDSQRLFKRYDDPYNRSPDRLNQRLHVFDRALRRMGRKLGPSFQSGVYQGEKLSRAVREEKARASKRFSPMYSALRGSDAYQSFMSSRDKSTQDRMRHRMHVYAKAASRDAASISDRVKKYARSIAESERLDRRQSRLDHIERKRNSQSYRLKKSISDAARGFGRSYAGFGKFLQDAARYGRHVSGRIPVRSGGIFDRRSHEQRARDAGRGAHDILEGRKADQARSRALRTGGGIFPLFGRGGGGGGSRGPQDGNAVSRFMGRSSTGLGLRQFGVFGGAYGGVRQATQGYKTAANFDYILRRIAAVDKSPPSEMDALRKKIMKVGAETMFTATDVAGAAMKAKLAGRSNSEIIQALPIFANFAAAAGLGAEDATTKLLRVMSGARLSPKQLEQTTDVMTSLFTRFNTDLTQLSEGLKFSLGSGYTLGIDPTMTAAMIATAQDKGLVGGRAGMSYNRFIKDITGTKKAKALGRFGFDASKYMDKGKVVDMPGLLKEWQSAFERSNGAINNVIQERASRIGAIVGDENALAELLMKYYAALTDLGATKRIAKASQEGGQGALNRATAAVENARISLFGDGEKPGFMTNAVETFAKSMNAFASQLSGGTFFNELTDIVWNPFSNEEGAANLRLRISNLKSSIPKALANGDFDVAFQMEKDLIEAQEKLRKRRQYLRTGVAKDDDASRQNAMNELKRREDQLAKFQEQKNWSEAERVSRRIAQLKESIKRTAPSEEELIEKRKQQFRSESDLRKAARDKKRAPDVGSDVNTQGESLLNFFRELKGELIGIKGAKAGDKPVVTLDDAGTMKFGKALGDTLFEMKYESPSDAIDVLKPLLTRDQYADELTKTGYLDNEEVTAAANQHAADLATQMQATSQRIMSGGDQLASTLGSAGDQAAGSLGSTSSAANSAAGALNGLASAASAAIAGLNAAGASARSAATSGMAAPRGNAQPTSSGGP